LNCAAPDRTNQARQARHRDPDPSRPVGGFVGNLVSSLLDQKEADQIGDGRGISRACGFPIGARECGRSARVKLCEEFVALSHIHWHGAHACAVDECRTGIVDGTKKTRDVPQWACFGSTFCDRSSGFALEIDDVGIAIRDEHMTKMKITVDARHQSSNAGFGEIMGGLYYSFALA